MNFRHWPVASLLCVSLLWTGLSAQRPEHRDRLATGLVPVVTTLPAEPAGIKPSDIEILDDGRVVTPAHVAIGERVALAILVDVSLGERERVAKLLGEVQEGLSAIPVDGAPIRHLNQFKFKRPRSGRPDFQTARLDQVTVSDESGRWRAQGKPEWSAADWVIASLQFRQGRRVVIVVTDGTLEPMFVSPPLDIGVEKVASFSDFRSRLRSQFATVFVVAINNARLPSEWRDIAVESGGAVLTVGPSDEIRPTLVELAGRIARQSVIYFAPAALDGKTHRVQVRLKDGGAALPSASLYLSPKGER